MSVFVGSGQPLVIGTNASTLVTTCPPRAMAARPSPYQTPGGGTVTMPESLLEGGQLGGLLAFRRDSLDAAQKQLGLVAAGSPLTSTRSWPRPGSRWRAWRQLSSVKTQPPCLGGGRCHQRCLRGLWRPSLTGDDCLLTITGAAGYALSRSFRRAANVRRGRPRHYALGARGGCG